MAFFTILSWNIETFGEKKLAQIAQYVAKVVSYSKADMVLFIESTKYGQTEIARDIPEALRVLTGDSWFAFGSDPTGKISPLPLVIPYASFPKIMDSKDFKQMLRMCYDDKPTLKMLTIKASYTEREASDCRNSLSAVGYTRRDVETYTCMFRYDPTIYKDSQGPLIALGSYVGIPSGRPPYGQPGILVSFDPAGMDIGYQTPGSTFAGRSPYIANLYFSSTSKLGDVAAPFPLACFHAPFGDAITPRISADAGLMRLATPNPGGASIQLDAQPQGAAAADFNIDFKWTDSYVGLTNPIPNYESPSTRVYGAFAAAGFGASILELTTLTTVQSANKTWTNPLLFRSSAYDNVLVSGVGAGKPITASVGKAIDLVQDTFIHASYLSNLALPTWPNMYSAFAYVREEISDHLPVVCQLTVAGRP
ncbi:MAG: hypothetical protein WBQ21_10660 [Solirubrobacteraceae bacterium]